MDTGGGRNNFLRHPLSGDVHFEVPLVGSLESALLGDPAAVRGLFSALPSGQMGKYAGNCILTSLSSVIA